MPFSCFSSGFCILLVIHSSTTDSRSQEFNNEKSKDETSAINGSFIVPDLNSIHKIKLRLLYTVSGTPFFSSLLFSFWAFSFVPHKERNIAKNSMNGNSKLSVSCFYIVFEWYVLLLQWSTYHIISGNHNGDSMPNVHPHTSMWCPCRFLGVVNGKK